MRQDLARVRVTWSRMAGYCEVTINCITTNDGIEFEQKRNAQSNILWAAAQTRLSAVRLITVN